jgi:hypothetical protein
MAARPWPAAMQKAQNIKNWGLRICFRGRFKVITGLYLRLKFGVVEEL